MDPTFLTIAIFVFALGACVGSFLNVVVYRLPKEMSLVSPPSTCPSCGHRLAAYDNVPIFGWVWLRGRCRYCKTSISPRYPIVELVTGLLFLGHFLLLFHYGWGPYQENVTPFFGYTQITYDVPQLERDWPILLLHLWLIGALLAASLIDLEHFIIPLGICWLTAVVGAIGHTFALQPGELGALHNEPTIDALALGAGVGMLLSLLLLRLGVFKRSFADDAPPLEHDVEHLPDDQKPDPWPASRIRLEMSKEVLFLLPPVVFALVAAVLVNRPGEIANQWATLSAEPHVSGLLGSLLGALVGGAVVWFFRIAGSIGFGREAMGLGDVHLMFGVGAIIGAGASTVAFFLAPLFGLTIALLQLFIQGKREIPYGPYLSLATYAVMLLYTPIEAYLRPGMEGLVIVAQGLFS